VPLDGRGRYRTRGRFSGVVIGVYAFLIVLVVVLLRGSFSGSGAWVPIAVVAALAFFLARYLSTRYTIDDRYLHAVRLLGGGRLDLEKVRRIEYARLRDLGATGFTGSWGWRGRMWSPIVGRFDALHTEPDGLLVSAEPAGMFVSPRDPATFARELSRRVRSYTGRLEVDVGDPRSDAAAGRTLDQ